MAGGIIETDQHRLTPKGAATRLRIVEAAAQLMHDSNVSDTTLLDIQKRAKVSGSQLYHYFADKDEIVHAVIEYRTSTFMARQQLLDFSTVEGFCEWRDRLVTFVGSRKGLGGCPIGSLGGQLAETDEVGRSELEAAFERWQGVFRQVLETMRAEGRLSAAADPTKLATALLAAAQGGLVLAQVRRDARPVKDAIDSIVELIRTYSPLDDEPGSAEALPVVDLEGSLSSDSGR